jgi:signal transduction histidine kinase
MAASQLTDDSPAEDVLNLQNAARNAIFNVEIPTHPPIRPALERICEVSRLMADGATSSIIVRNGSGWEVGAACGAGAEKITGMPVDPHGKSVTGFVISARKPYYFANIASLPELTARENRNRTLGGGFISLPVIDHSGALLGVLNVAGMPSNGAAVRARRDSIAGILDAIAAKLAKIRETESLFSALESPGARIEAEADKEKLLFMSVHDIKNSLTLIKANIYYLEQLNLGEEARKIINLIKFGGDRSLDLALSILDSRMMRDQKLRPNMRDLDLTPLLVFIIKEFEVYASKVGVDICFIGPDTVKVLADRSLLRRMVGNLLDNALKHSPAGGKVTVSISTSVADSIDVFVEDQGKGIGAENREKIFDLYGGDQDASSGSTYGIGLAFCRLASRAQGGSIWVEPGSSGGSRFVIRLPVR